MSPQTIRNWEAFEKWLMRGAGAVALYFLIDTHGEIKAMRADVAALRTASALHELRLTVHDSRIDNLERNNTRQ